MITVHEHSGTITWQKKLRPTANGRPNFAQECPQLSSFEVLYEAEETCREYSLIRTFTFSLLSSSCGPVHGLHFCYGGFPANFHRRIVISVICMSHPTQEWVSLGRGLRLATHFETDFLKETSVTAEKYRRRKRNQIGTLVSKEPNRQRDDRRNIQMENIGLHMGAANLRLFLSSYPPEKCPFLLYKTEKCIKIRPMENGK